MGGMESFEKVTQPLLRQYSCMTLGLNSVFQNHETSPANACQGPRASNILSTTLAFSRWRGICFCSFCDFPPKQVKLTVCFGGYEYLRFEWNTFLVFWFHPKQPIYVSCWSPQFQRKRNGVRNILAENKFPPNWVLGGSDPAPNSAVSRPFSPKV